MASPNDSTQNSEHRSLEDIFNYIDEEDGENYIANPIPILSLSSISCAVVDEFGQVILANPEFLTLIGTRLIDVDAVARAARGYPSTSPVEIDGLDGRRDVGLLAYALGSQVLNWRLPPDIKSAAMAAPNRVVVLSCHAASGLEPLEAACRAYGLSTLQTRVTRETVRHGQVRAAALSLGISFHTAREALAEAMRRVGTSKVAGLIATITSIMFGVLPSHDDADILADVWGLTKRQAAVAGLISSGLTRAEAARALEISEAVVKKELDWIYLQLNVGNAGALARKVVESRALRWITQATDGDIGFLDSTLEPLRFVMREDGSRIAVSDYGPRSGLPVLVTHTPMTTRIIISPLLRALQQAGYRPLAIDRPGYGLTDEISGARPGLHDPYATAADDVELVLDRLKIRSVDVVCRGGTPLIQTLQMKIPERLGRVVLVNPGLYQTHDTRRVGAFGRMKDAFKRNPVTVRFFISTITRKLSYDRYEAMLKQWMRGSPPDEAAANDPIFAREYFRSLRMFAAGKVAGFVNEQVELMQGTPRAPIKGTSDWRIIVGGCDTLYDPAEVISHWREQLPDAGFMLAPDAGRLLAVTHPRYVVEELCKEI